MDMNVCVIHLCREVGLVGVNWRGQTVCCSREGECSEGGKVRRGARL